LTEKNNVWQNFHYAVAYCVMLVPTPLRTRIAKLLLNGLVRFLVDRRCNPGPTWKSADWRGLGNPQNPFLKRGFGDIYTDTLKWPNFTVGLRCLRLPSSL